jgi:hypothetical protein
VRDPIGVFPKDAPRETLSRAERAVWAALERTLPEGWSAWHSVRGRAQFSVDCEVDFFVAVPERGVLVLEVKGGHIALEGGHWTQNGHRLDKSPRAQALGAIHIVVKQLKRRHPEVPLPFFAAVSLFPETDFEFGPSGGDVEGAVLGRGHMENLGAALREVAERLLEPKAPPIERWRPLLHELWGEDWSPRVSLGALARRALARVAELDDAQRRLLDTVDRNRRMLVSGRPGTGKSFLAAELARRWAAEGHAPILVCFTRALAVAYRAQGFTASTIRELEAEVLEASGALAAEGPSAAWGAELWAQAPARCLEALAKHPMHFEALIVDEGQDLEAGDWEVLRRLTAAQPGERRPSRLWIFADEGQSFWAGRGVPEDLSEPVFELAHVHRGPAGLAAFAARYRSGYGEDPESLRPGVPTQEDLRLIFAAPQALESAVAHEVSRLLEAGVEPGHIAVLSLAGQTRTAIGASSHVGGHPVVRADDTHAGEEIIADTFLRFKGLERPFVILCELGLGSDGYAVRMHIALTRALVGLVVVASEAEVRADPSLEALRNRG